MFHMPISSPMIKTMLGFLVSAACAAAAMNATHRATAHCFSIFGFGFIFFVFLSMSFGSWRDSLSWGKYKFRRSCGLYVWDFSSIRPPGGAYAERVRKSERGCSRVVGEATTVFS